MTLIFALIVAVIGALLTGLHAAGALSIDHLALWACIGFIFVAILLLPSVPWRAPS